MVDRIRISLKKTKSDSNIEYSKKKIGIISKNDKISKNTKINNTKITKTTKNTKANNDNIINDMIHDCIKLTKKQKNDIREYDYVKYINKTGKLVCGYVNKIYIHKEENEVGWIMSAYISKSAMTWSIFPHRTLKIYKKI